jgi:hypothetical protein
MEIVRRKRGQAFYDKVQSFSNYDSIPDSNVSKKAFVDNFSKTIDIEIFKKNIKKRSVINIEVSNILPPVPSKIANPNKIFKKPLFDDKVFLCEWFDEYELIHNTLKTIDFKRFINEFIEEDYKQMNFSDVYGFDLKEYDVLDKKFRELKSLFKETVLDKQLYEYFKYSRYDMDESKENIKLVHQNFDKIDRIAYLDNTIKFFLKANNITNQKQ